MGNRFWLEARREHFSRRVGLYIGVMQGDRVTAVAESLQFKTVEDGEIVPVPTMQLHMDDAQRLIDSLWDAGLRPTEGAGSAGAMAATQQHLQDMRRLVFDERRVEMSGAPMEFKVEKARD